VGDAAGVVTEDEAEPFEVFEVGGDGFEFCLGDVAGELDGDLFGAPFAGGGAQQVANGGKLFSVGWVGHFFCFTGSMMVSSGVMMPSRVCLWARSASVKGSPVRSFSSRLYMPVMMISGWVAWTCLR